MPKGSLVVCRIVPESCRRSDGAVYVSVDIEHHHQESAAFIPYIYIAFNLPCNNTKLYWSREMLNFIFLEKDVGIISSPNFVYDFFKKMFLILYSISWPYFIVWSPLLRYWTICVLQLFVSQVVTSSVLKLTYLSNEYFFILDQRLKTKI